MRKGEYIFSFYQGYEIAQNNAGWLYEHGEIGELSQVLNVEYQHKRSFDYYRNSAEQNNAFSMLKIGDYYFEGFGTTQNMEMAAQYYRASSEMRNPQALFNLGYMHQVSFQIIFSEITIFYYLF